MRVVESRKPRRALAYLLSGLLALVLFSCSLCAVRSPPSWWKAGRPRRRPGSLAEAELLSHLAVLLLPEEPIEELFRDFPAEKSDGWGRNTLSPDLALYGVFESQEAGLFAEYDGYYRHLKPAGIAADRRKTTALLDWAPNGSYVLRIAPAHRGLELSCEMGEVVVDSWQPGQDLSLVKALLQVAEFLLRQRGNAMHPDRRAKLQNFVEDPGGSSRQAAVQFTEEVAAERKRDFDPTHLHDFLQTQLDLLPSQAVELVGKCPALTRCDIDDRLKPMMQQLEEWGLKKSQVAKVFARFPNVLGCSIPENLKPTARWLRVLGLTKAEVAKVIARCPQVLGYSIEENLKRTVQWLRDLGLTKAAIVKVIARCPRVLGYSIDDNLKPTAQWLRDLGLTKAALAKVIARFPQVLGLSIDDNLKPAVQWLRDVGLTKAALAKVIARFPQVLGLSIDDNLKPAVQWLRDVGLTQADVATVIARHASFLGLSLEKNLKPKVFWLLGRFSPKHVRRMLTRNPYMFGLSHIRWVRRSQVLQDCGKLSVFGSAVMLTDAAFAARYEGKQQRSAGAKVLYGFLASEV